MGDNQPNVSNAVPSSGSPAEHVVGLLERIAVALETPGGATVRRSTGSMPVSGGLHNEDRATIKDLKASMSVVQEELAEIKSILTAERGEIVKEAYTVDEVAKKTKLAPYTIRQACNKRRIKGAYKAKDGAWRIPRADLTDILNNGLPPE